MILCIWLAVTAILWAVVSYRLYRSMQKKRGYRDVPEEKRDVEEAVGAWVLMWVLSGWLPCAAWIIIS